MYAADKNALLCDMAETYGIYDLQALPVSTTAILACGLRKDSRIIMKMSGVETSVDTMLLACVVDRLSTIAWMNSKDGAKNRNRPKSVLNAFLKSDSETRPVGFDSPDAFMAARAKIAGG